MESDTAPRVRLLTKFVSDDYEKVDRLLELREAAENRVSRWKGVEGVDLDADELLLGKLENGLATLQLADYVLAWICMEDDGASRCVIVHSGRLLVYHRFEIMQGCCSNEEAKTLVI